MDPTPGLTSLEARVEDVTAAAACAVESPEYIVGGEVEFSFAATDGTTVVATSQVAGAYAEVTGVKLAGGKRYTVVARCAATNGATVESNSATIEVAAQPTEAWLELPAIPESAAHTYAQEVKVACDGERNYTHYYDSATYTSLWVAYPLESRHMGDNARPSSWAYNPYIDVSAQVNLCSHSYNDDYSRGHLIPNASRDGIEGMQRQTFYVTNSVPQIQNSFNSGVWSTLEGALQSIATTERIYIVTGVAFNKVGETKSVTYTTAKDDTKEIPVPNYFYKVVLRATTDSNGMVTRATTVGVWFEHKTYSDSYTNYTVSVDQVEEWTGFDFFENLPDSVETTAEQNSSWETFTAF